MSAFVVDTNVLVVANEKSNHVEPGCVLASVRSLRKVRKRGRLMLDDLGKILKEYRQSRYLSLSGQPGLGDYFVKWAHDNQANPKRCTQVKIVPKADDPEDFEEFPEDPDLHSFDRSDRKYVAVALACEEDPLVLNATDTDWWRFRGPLKRHRVRVEFLCPELMENRR